MNNVLQKRYDGKTNKKSSIMVKNVRLPSFLSLFRNVEILISIGYKTYVDHYLTINNHMRRLWPKAFKLADVVFESVGRTDAYPAADLSVLQSTGADVEYLANIVTNIL